MHFFRVIFFLAYTFARPRSIYILRIKDKLFCGSIKVDGDRISVSDATSNFNDGSEGTLRSLKNGKYLGFSSEGKLILQVEPHKGFNYTTSPESAFLRALTYNGTDAFVHCWDGSIRLNKKCRGAHVLKISFDDNYFP